MIYRLQNRQKKKLSAGTKMFLVLLPSIIYVFMTGYKPLIGLGYAFVEYKPRVSIWESEFVGLKYYKSLINNSIQAREFWFAIRNTLIFAVISISTSYLAMFLTLLLNEIKCKWYRRTVQTIITIPNFLSWVLIYSSMYMILAPNSGLMHDILNKLGIIEGSFDFLVNEKYGYLLRFLMGNWKGLGWGTIVYFAALSSVDTELYEAADIDGAGRFQKMFYVSLPHILPTYITLLIMSIGTILNGGIDFPLVFSNVYNRNTLTNIDYYVYNTGLVSFNIGVGTAVGFAKSVIGVCLMFFANYLSKKIRGAGIM